MTDSRERMADAYEFLRSSIGNHLVFNKRLKVSVPCLSNFDAIVEEAMKADKKQPHGRYVLEEFELVSADLKHDIYMQEQRFEALRHDDSAPVWAAMASEQFLCGLRSAKDRVDRAIKRMERIVR